MYKRSVLCKFTCFEYENVTNSHTSFSFNQFTSSKAIMLLRRKGIIRSERE